MRTRERASSSLLPAPPPHPGPRPPLPAPLPHACARSQHSRRSRWRLRISNARPVSKSSNCGWGGRWVGACGWLVGWVGGWVQVGAGGCRWAGGRGRAQPCQRKGKAAPPPPPPPLLPPRPPPAHLQQGLGEDLLHRLAHLIHHCIVLLTLHPLLALALGRAFELCCVGGAGGGAVRCGLACVRCDVRAVRACCVATRWPPLATPR